MRYVHSELEVDWSTIPIYRSIKSSLHKQQLHQVLLWYHYCPLFNPSMTQSISIIKRLLTNTCRSQVQSMLIAPFYVRVRVCVRERERLWERERLAGLTRVKLRLFLTSCNSNPGMNSLTMTSAGVFSVAGQCHRISWNKRIRCMNLDACLRKVDTVVPTSTSYKCSTTSARVRTHVRAENLLILLY